MNKMEEIKNDNINPNLCKCRKNKLYGLYEQCTNKRNNGNFCGKHFKGKDKLLIDEPLPQEYSKIISLEKFIQNKNTLNKATLLELFNTQVYYKLELMRGKDNMVNNIRKYFLLLEDFSTNEKLEKIKKIQYVIKKYIQDKEKKLKGPAFLNRSICNNTDDFLTFEEVKNIPDKYFFSFRDKDNFVYGFDIRSFKKLIDSKIDNPYNRNKIPKQAITNLRILLKNPKYKLQEIQDNNITKEQKMNQMVLSVFQKIDELETYAGGTNIDWFLNLSSNQLKLYYKTLEDIWNYRSELTHYRKNEIVPNKKMFPLSVHSYYNIVDKKKLRKIALHEMDKLISSSEKREDRILGSYYILIGLVEVSQDVANALPWLVQF